MNEASNRPQIYASVEQLPDDVRRLDHLHAMLYELFFIEHPMSQKRDVSAQTDAKRFAARSSDGGIWVYYPWLNTAIRIPSEDSYFRLRTARNRDLITDDEQRRYRGVHVGIAGLSVGSSAALALAMTGGPKRIRLADPDTIEASNLNRIQARLPDVGMNKTEMMARAIWERDPFAELDLWQEGLTSGRLDEFLDGLDVFVDEMDDIGLKFAVRDTCRKKGIPVIMATDNGDGAILDIERYDLEPERQLFHGRVERPTGSLEDLDRAQFIDLANRIIDESYYTQRQLDSVRLIGSKLAGVPQLGTAALISGAVVACAVRSIAVGLPLSSGRYRTGYEIMVDNGPALGTIS